MDELLNFSLKIKNLKCFGEHEQGFDQIRPINLIIGRNNSGKSALIDLIEYVIKGHVDAPERHWHDRNRPEIIAESPLTEEELKKVFPERTGGSPMLGIQDMRQFRSDLIGTKITWKIHTENSRSRFISIGNSLNNLRPLNGMKQEYINDYLKKLADVKINPLFGKIFNRIYAERNIVPESENLNLDTFGYGNSGNGNGATNIIQNFINNANLSSELVQVTLLEELNKIFLTDAVFTEIVCQRIPNNLWEIYLKEESKGRIPLSQSGSGLKTIILVLIYILLVPVVRNKALSDFVFGFEELENNLHPALQRRLLSYLRNVADKHGCIFFLTTHSNVEIDLFSKDNKAQILHVTHDGTKATSRTVKTYIENRGILDDLDIRASDLLQSNGIIWVEGPSDRIYLNRWIELWSNGQLHEGAHYQCIFYGGRLLSHLSSEEPELVEGSISILRANRNCAILIDSDKSSQRKKLNNTKQRIIIEISKNEGYSWVTKGKEIENYIPAESIISWKNRQNIEQVEQYVNFFEYLNKIENGQGDYYSSQKPLLAEKLVPYMTKESIARVLDLGENLEKLCNFIRGWNKL
ncbi:MAG: AAA family ATPase [Gammaproteobacteria bacterium]|nr:AAA family ATPase [Gammaproteobacteria bacterium]